MEGPLITISIPTFNSEKFLKLCLDAIEAQSYKNFEINIVDGGSKDATIEIAKAQGIKNIVVCKESLLKSRFIGAEKAKGEYILLLDSDQLLDATALQLLVDSSAEADMVIMGEDVYKTDTFLEKLFSCDRKLVHAIKDLDPKTSVMLPRFYKKELLISAFKNIPKDVLESVGGQDHAIIYYEACELSKKVTLVPNLVKHIEPSKLIPMIKKFYRWGYTSVGARHNRYDVLFQEKECFRKGLFKKGLFLESVASVLLLLIKGIPYKLGYYKKRLYEQGK